MKKRLALLCVLTMLVQLLSPIGTIVSQAETVTLAVEQSEPTEYVAAESPAVTYNMNIDWKYKRAADDAVFPLATAAAGVAKDGKQFYEVGYDDSDWETVSVPHAINAEDSFDGVGVDAGEASLYRGFMFYRKTITIPESDAGKKFLLEFEAFRQSVYVYVNGVMVGYNEAGVTAAGFDITDYIVAGKENLIAVATDNASGRGSSFTTQETVPGHEPGDLSGVGYQWNTKDFNEVQGGLTGNVNLYAKNMIYQTLPLYSNLKTTGNYIYGSNFDLRENSADITVKAEVRNETGEAKDITLQVDVVDGDGMLVASFAKTAKVAAATDTYSDLFLTTVPETAYDENGVGLENGVADYTTVDVTYIEATQNVGDLHFWSDESPYLYTVHTYLKDGDTIIDHQEEVTGFREVTYDKDKGLQINGVTTYLKGYAQRSTNEWAVIGVANDWLSDIDMQLVKESNANYIRWMHIAPNPVDIRAGDKYGVISVCPAGDKEGDVTGRSWDQRLEAMRDTIIYLRNSPSIIFWEAGNNAITAEHMKQMTDLRKALDPEGDRFMGCRTISSVEQIQEAEWAGTMIYRNDAAAYASMVELGKYMPMLETEYHRNEAPRRVWDDYSPPYYDYVNKWLGSGASKTDGYDIWDQTQEDFSLSMLGSGDCYSYFYNNRVGGTGNNYYSGAAMMVWSDSNMHVRNCGVENCRTSGRVDAVRIKKESFYAIQAAQADEPAINILGHWNYPSYIEGDTENGNYWYEDKTFNGTYWEGNGTMLQRDPTNKTVYVIGSADVSKVELYVNDELVGTDSTPKDNFIYAFDGIDVTQSGQVSAKAYNDREEVVAEDVIKTAGEAATIRLTPVTGPEGWLADGSDIVYVDVEVVDAEGNVCPLDERKISFTVSDENVTEFLGGYNSGVGDRIVNHKDYVFAECGVNRVFLRATREAGSVTLTATGEGMQPVSITLETTAVELEGGLTTHAQQAYAQGEVPIIIPPETAPALKSLAESFTADFTEETGNVKVVSEDNKDYYAVNVNGTAVSFTDRAYKPDSSTGVVGEVGPILDALKAAGMELEYTFATEGGLPEYFGTEGGVLPLMTIKSGDTTIELANVATVVFTNGEKNLTNFGVIPNSTNTTLLAELSAVIGKLPGVTIVTDAEGKVFDITMSSAVDVVAVADMDAETVGVDAAEEEKTVDVLEIAAAVEEAVPVEEGTVDGAEIEAVVEEASGETADILTAGAVDTVYEYDTIVVYNNCDAVAGVTSTLTLSEDTSPDGTKYLMNTSGADAHFDGLAANSTLDFLWEADIRFDEDGSGVTPRDLGDKKYGTCIRRHGNYLAVQTGGSDFKDYVEIDPEKWYHIALIGRYSAADANVDMIVYEYNGSERVYIDTYTAVSLRNLWAGNGSGAQHWDVHNNTSVDNMRMVQLGADTLTVTAEADTLKAGNVMQMEYSATRQGEYITKPAVTWSVYNANNTAELNDANITIDANGALNVGLDAAAQSITVRATAESGIYASKTIAVTSVDLSGVKFDTLTLSAEREYVSETEPLTITAAATKGGSAVTITDEDLIWYVCDADDMRKLGDDLKWIKVENGVLTVDEKAVSQDITVRAADSTDAVRGSFKVHIKSSNALEGNEEGAMDRLLYSSSCEAALANTEFVTSVDGTSAYHAVGGITTGHISETGGDIVIEMDIRFSAEGAGFQPAKSGKVNTCVLYKDGKLAVQTGGSKFTYYSNEGEVTTEDWYHLTLIRKKGAYAHMILDYYDENGNIDLSKRKVMLDVNQRNDENTAFINVNAGTMIDNLRILTPTPTDITISTDVTSIFAGNTVQASSELQWNGLPMRNPDATMFEYKIYDAEDKYPLENDKITVDANGLVTVDATVDAQDVYIRAIAKQSGKYASAKFTIIPSDIFAVTSLGVNEDMSKIVNVEVQKNFYYADEVTFVTGIFDENGAMKAISTKLMYGDALRTGENTVAIGMELPADFDKTKDTIKVFVVTKLSTKDAAVAEEGTSVAINEGSLVITAPAFDAASEVVVLVLDRNADDTDVKDSDILYYNQVKSEEVSNAIPVGALDACIAKVGGKVNGASTVKAALLGEADPDEKPEDKPDVKPDENPKGELPFTDLPADKTNWKYTAANYVYQNSIMSGTSAATFEPDASMTRAMFVQTLYNMESTPAVTDRDIFTDVAATAWYRKAVTWAVDNDITSGVGEGLFGSETPINREQLATLLYNYAKAEGHDVTGRTSLNNFGDSASVSEWATESLQWAVNAGVMSGKPQTDGSLNLDPKTEATRAECATMIRNFCQKYVD